MENQDKPPRRCANIKAQYLRLADEHRRKKEEKEDNANLSIENKV